MAGLRKAKKYDWKDSNLALFGTPLEREIKKKSAETEKAWKVVNEIDEPHLFIWRIVKFVPTPWPKEEYGKFFSGDSYIILNKYINPGENDFQYDVHFWIGKFSSQDEYGTAAYKTVELDTFLDDKPVQHREVQGHESTLFKSYFPTIEIMEGGVESGFRHVTPDKYESRLLHVYGERKNIIVREVPFFKKSINSVDCFILDAGKTLYQLNGKDANKDERMKAVHFANKIRSEHNGAKLVVIDESCATSDDLNEFFSLLPDGAPYDEDDVDSSPADTKKLFKLSDASGNLKFSQVSDGKIDESMFDPKDVFIADTGDHLFVWIGKGASKSENRSAMIYGHKYLMGTANPLRTISSVHDGKEGTFFREALALTA